MSFKHTYLADLLKVYSSDQLVYLAGFPIKDIENLILKPYRRSRGRIFVDPLRGWLWLLADPPTKINGCVDWAMISYGYGYDYSAWVAKERDYRYRKRLRMRRRLRKLKRGY